MTSGSSRNTFSQESLQKNKSFFYRFRGLSTSLPESEPPTATTFYTKLGVRAPNPTPVMYEIPKSFKLYSSLSIENMPHYVASAFNRDVQASKWSWENSPLNYPLCCSSCPGNPCLDLPISLSIPQSL